LPGEEDPAFERSDDGSIGRGTSWLVAQQLHEMAGDLARNSERTDRLIADVGDLAKDVKGLNRSLTFAKGFGAAAVFLIPVCAAMVWWLIGGKLDDIRDEMYRGIPKTVTSSPASASPDRK